MFFKVNLFRELKSMATIFANEYPNQDFSDYGSVAASVVDQEMRKIKIKEKLAHYVNFSYKFKVTPIFIKFGRT